MDPHTIQALDGAAHVWMCPGEPGIPASVRLDVKESLPAGAEASIGLSPDAADALASVLRDAAARARAAQSIAVESV